MSNFAESHSLPTFEERKAASKHKNITKWIKADKIVDLVYCDIANGLTNSDIMKKLQEGAYEGMDRGIHARTSHDYIKAAHQRMHYDFESKLPQMREDLYLKFMTIYEDAIKSNDRYNAIGALKGLMDVVGLNSKSPQTAILINGDKDGGITVNFGFQKEE